MPKIAIFIGRKGKESLASLFLKAQNGVEDSLSSIGAFLLFKLLDPFPSSFSISSQGKEETMAGEAPSWADQWGAGGVGSMEDDNYTGTKRDTSKKEEVDAKTGLNKAKASAMSGAQKLKSGASNSFKWVKSKCQKK